MARRWPTFLQPQHSSLRHFVLLHATYFDSFHVSDFLFHCMLLILDLFTSLRLFVSLHVTYFSLHVSPTFWFTARYLLCFPSRLGLCSCNRIVFSQELLDELQHCYTIHFRHYILSTKLRAHANILQINWINQTSNNAPVKVDASKYFFFLLLPDCA